MPPTSSTRYHLKCCDALCYFSQTMHHLSQTCDLLVTLCVSFDLLSCKSYGGGFCCYSHCKLHKQLAALSPLNLLQSFCPLWVLVVSFHLHFLIYVCLSSLRSAYQSRILLLVLKPSF